MPDPEISDAEATCPRCGAAMERGYVSSNKSAARWVSTVRQNKTVFGGEGLVRQHRLWGRHVLPAARCTTCRFGVFTYPGADEFGPSR